MDFGIASVAAITVVCYLVGMVVKAIPRNVGGAWKEVEAAYVNVGGTWKEIS